MEILQTIILVINIISALSVVALVLMQHGKGADMGTAFGSGSAGSLFGSSGSANFLSRTTAFCAVIFFVTCFILAVMVAPRKSDAGLAAMGSIQQQAAVSQMSPADTQKSSKIPD